MYRALLSRAGHRITTAFRPKTVKTHSSHLTTLLQFLQFINLDVLHMTHCTTLAFIEFLQYNGLSASSIEGYISSLRSQFKALNMSIAPLTHHSVHLAMRSIALNVPTTRKVKGIFDIQSLTAIIAMCDKFSLGYIYKSVFLLAFFAFLRLSNLVPPSISSFCTSTHLCRGDLILQPQFATLILK